MRSPLSLVSAFVSVVLSLFALISFVTPAGAAMSDQSLEATVAKRLKGDRTGANLAVAVIEGDQVARAFVAAGEASDALRIGADSAFEIGSITKTMTAALLADLILQGNASLDTLLSDWLPEETQVPSFEGQPIRLRHIVTHTSGLPALPSRMKIVDPSNPYAKLTKEALLASLEDVTLSAPPGKDYSYSNFAVILLSYAIARQTETDFETLLSERLFSPLGMSGAYVAKRTKGVRTARGHTPYDAKRTAAWTFDTDFAGVGGVRATLDDMVRYMQAQLVPSEDRIGAALRLTQETLYSGHPSLGMHWMIREVEGRRIAFHGGGTGGFSSFVAFDSEGQHAVVILSDTSWSSIGGGANLALHLLFPSSVPLDAPRKRIDPPGELLNALVGEYTLGGGMRMTLRQKKGSLYVHPQHQPEYEMGYDSAGDFYLLKTTDAVLRPQLGSDGSTSFVWLQGGGSLPATRINTPPDGTELSEPELAAYAGDYPLMPGFVLTIRIRSGTLEGQATGQAPLTLKSSGKDRFGASAFGINIVFNRDASGEVESLTLYQGGQTLHGKRTIAAAAPKLETESSMPPVGDLSEYGGKYPLMPGFVLTIRVRSGTLEGQATGQGAFLLQPGGDKDRFAAPTIGLQIHFNRDASGEVKSLTLYQGGQTLRGKRE